MRFKIDLDHPDDINAYGDFLKALAAVQKDRPPTPLFGFGGIDRASNRFWRDARNNIVVESLRDAGEEAATAEAPDAAVNAAEAERAEPVKKTRAKKTTTVADLPADVVAEAKAAGINVEDESRIPGNVADPVQGEKDEETAPEVENAPERVEKDVDEKPLTEEQVRNTIIDFLNEVQAANPDKPDARSVTLKGLLDKLGAQKISLIPQAEYSKVPGLIAEARKAAGL